MLWRTKPPVACCVPSLVAKEVTTPQLLDFLIYIELQESTRWAPYLIIVVRWWYFYQRIKLGGISGHVWLVKRRSSNNPMMFICYLHICAIVCATRRLTLLSIVIEMKGSYGRKMQRMQRQ